MPATPTNNIHPRVLVALSGGVDSSVAVYLLRQQGYEVESIVLEFSPSHKKAVNAACVVAKQLKVPLHIVQCYDAFEENVILPFCKEYQSGRTPNPCILCNPTTKFEIICQKARELGFEWVATGHYAKVEHLKSGVSVLKKADCLPRDQSYMLYRLTQEQLSMLILPLQGMEKTEVREIASKQNLASANSPDSQEICWLPDGNYPAFVESLVGQCPPGEFISPDGTVCGVHKGLLHYTVGQRKRLGVSLGFPVFIREIDPIQNRIYLARAGEDMACGVILSDFVLHPNTLLIPGVYTSAQVNVKVRSRAEEVPAAVTLLENDLVRVIFENPQRAPAPGQSCVLYSGSTVLGGGLIQQQLQ